MTDRESTAARHVPGQTDVRECDGDEPGQSVDGGADADRPFPAIDFGPLVDDVLDAAGVAVFLHDADRRLAWLNPTAESYFGLDGESVVGTDRQRLVREVLSHRVTNPDGFVASLLDSGGGAESRTFECRVSAGAGRPTRYLERRGRPVASGRYEGGLVEVYYDVTERRRREQALRRRHDELAAVERIHSVVSDVDRALVQATTQPEIEAAVTDRLAGDDAYPFAWIGDRNRATDRVAVRAGSGDDEFLWSGGLTNTLEPDGRGPVGDALVTGDLQVAPDLADRVVEEPWSAAALEAGYLSVAAIPLAYGEATYGVLGVYAERPHAFDDRELAALSQLGETVGHAIAAVTNRTLLLSDSVVELAFRVRNAESFFLRTSADLDCRFEVRQIVPTSDGGLLYYERLTGADPETVLDRAAASPSIEDVQVVSHGDGEALLAFTVTRSSPTMTLTEHGAQVTAAVADRGTGRIVALVGPGTDVRRLVEAVQETFPSVELLSKREVVRDVESVPGAGRRTLTGRLTDRQRAALEAAFHAGYFEWPRESTAEEVADAVGVSSPTLHYHLRNAQRELLSVLLDEGVGGPPADP